MRSYWITGRRTASSRRACAASCRAWAAAACPLPHARLPCMDSAHTRRLSGRNPDCNCGAHEQGETAVEVAGVDPEEFSQSDEEGGSPLQLRLAELEKGEEDCAHDRRLRHPRALQAAHPPQGQPAVWLSARVGQPKQRLNVLAYGLQSLC